MEAITESILEAIMSLSDYPVLYESDHSQREVEAQNEAWESDYRQEFKRELSKVVAAELEAQMPDDSYLPYVDWVKDEEWIDGVEDSVVDGWAWYLMEVANKYWQNEQGDGMYLDVEEIAKALTEEIGQEWRDWARGKQKEVQQGVSRSVRDGWARAYWGMFGFEEGTRQ